MKLRQNLNKLSTVVVLTALAAVVPATQAFAQFTLSVGQGGNYTAENVGGELKLQGVYSEARNAGHQLTVWRGATNNQVWLSRDNGKPFTIGGTVTFVSPTVAPFGSDSFMVFHTGDNGDIFYTQVFGDGHNSGTWTSVPSQFTNLSVSVAQMGANSNNLFMVYRGLGNDLRVWGTWFNGQTAHWANANNINGGMANSAPGVSMNNATNQLLVTAQGTDNKVWITHQALGASSWTGWISTGAFTQNTPHSVACANGNVVVSLQDGPGNPEFAKFDGFGNQQSGWFVDSEFPLNFDSPVQLTANGNNVYDLTNIDGSGLWRGIYPCD